MQNLESVAQKTAELPFDAPEFLPLLTPLNKISLNLFVQFIRTFMQNLETIAKKIAELLLDTPEIPLLESVAQKIA